MHEQADETLFSLHKNSYRKKLKTQNNFQNEKTTNEIQKWSGDNFYIDIRTKIHQKLKTQPTDNRFCKKNGKLQKQIGKPKSKLTISTLQIALDPYCQQMMQQPFEIQRKIHHKVQTNISVLKAKTQQRLVRNLSAKGNRIKYQTSEISKKQTLTCRKNSKQQPKTQKKQLILNKPQSKQFLLNKSQSKYEIVNKPQSKQEIVNKLILKSVCKEQQRQNCIFQNQKLQKSKSQYIKNENNPIKVQNFDVGSLIFYFKTRHNTKISTRQLSIKKIRTRNKLIPQIK